MGEHDKPVAWWHDDGVWQDVFFDGAQTQCPHCKPLYTHPAQWVGLTDDAIYAAAEIAWRAGWAACRDADFVGEEAEDETWGYQGASVVQDIEAALKEKNT